MVDILLSAWTFFFCLWVYMSRDFSSKYPPLIVISIADARAINNIDMNELGVKKKFEEEIERYKHFKRAMFGIDKPEDKIRKETNDIDFKTYAKYLLKEGSITGRGGKCLHES